MIIITILIFSMIPMLYCLNDKETIQREIQNLKAFAKMYGYVRFFYPGDEAQEIDWDQFAIYGCDHVLNAENDVELIRILHELFLPVAPGILVYQKNNHIDNSFKHIIPFDPENYMITHWQYNGIYMNSQIYDSKRTNRYFKIMKDDTFKKRYAVIKLKSEYYKEPYDTIRVKAYAYSDNSDSLDPHISVYYGYADQKACVKKEMIVNDWQDYQFEFAFNERQDKELQVFIEDFKTIYIENITVEVKCQNQWHIVEQIDFTNEIPGQNPTNLIFGAFYAKNIDYLIKDIMDNRVLEISQSNTANVYTIGFSDQIFNHHLSFPELVDKQLNDELNLLMPLTLYCKRDFTYPQSDQKKLNQLQSQLASIDKNAAFNTSSALGAVVIYWNFLQHFYPYWEYTENIWDEQLTIGLSEALQCQNDKEILFVIKKMASFTKDAHSYIDNYKIIKRQALPFRVDWIENKWIVISSLIESVKPGFEVLRIDNNDFYQFMKENRIYHEKATEHGTLANLLGNIISYYDNAEPEFVFLTSDSNQINLKVSLNQILPYDQLYNKQDKLIEYSDGIIYLNVNRGRINDTDLDGMYEKLADAKGLIFDLRYYPGISLNLLSHLMEKGSDIKDYFRQYVLYPDRDKVINGEAMIGWPIKPESPLIKAKSVILSGNRSQSYCESYIDFMKSYQLAIVIGQQTTGSTGNVLQYTLPGNINVIWSGMLVTNHDGSQFHGIGVIPDIEVKETIKGLSEGRDEILDEALEYLRGL
ncbi:MAG TPA: S41 family peptidase [Candidatus Cloacimonadota bacterium]|nr:S41 family peptidase [Candidatus Cloacimonadota bacterium]